MITSLVALVFAGQVASAPAQAPDAQLVPPASLTPPTTTAALSAEEEARQNEQICRTENVVGSRLSGRICMTRREWDQRREASRRLQQRVENAQSSQDRRAPVGR
jgi:hypothetical protein